MNQRQLLILSYSLYILPIPFAWIGAFIINVMATEYREQHIKSIKVTLWCFVLALIGLITVWLGIGVIILIIVLLWYYIHMIVGLFQALALKDEIKL